MFSLIKDNPQRIEIQFLAHGGEYNESREEKKTFLLQHYCPEELFNSICPSFARHVGSPLKEVPWGTGGHLSLVPELTPALYLTASSNWTSVFLTQTIWQLSLMLPLGFALHH